MGRRVSKIKKKSFLNLIIFIILLIVAVALIADDESGSTDVLPQDYPMEVSFIDVGQGDCILLECENQYVLVDGGEAEYADTVVKYLNDKNITDIDCYVATHPHSDHIGAAAGIFESLNIKSVIMTAFSEINTPTTVTYENFITAVSDEKCEVHFVTAGQTYSYGSLTLNILSPYDEVEDYNNMSVVIKAVYKNTSFLLTGDAEKSAEKLMLENGADLKADVLKVGHHGSDTSTSPDFLKAVSPLCAVISVGNNNIYNHPSDETIKVLKALSFPIYRTDTDGTVVLYSNGEVIFAEDKS